MGMGFANGPALSSGGFEKRRRAARTGAAKLMASALCATALAIGGFSTAPSMALAQQDRNDAPELQGAALGSNAAALELRAKAIEAHAGAYEDDGIIIVWRSGVNAQRQNPSGLAPQSLAPWSSGPVSAEVLSEHSGIEGGGAAVRVDVPAGMSVGQAVAAAEADIRVAHAQPIYRYRPLDAHDMVAYPYGVDAQDATLGRNAIAGTASPAAMPNDPALQNLENEQDTANQWWIPAVNAPAAWETVHGDDNDVAVAVLDTGVNFDHPDLKANLLTEYAYDAYLDQPLTESPASEEMAHGSHVAGIVAAEANNGVGIAGVSYNAKVLPICVFHLAYDEAYGYGKALCDDADLIRAYDYLLGDSDGDGKTVAEETHTRVVNMSLGGYIADDPSYEYDYAFEAKIEQAEAAGILTVAAGGNGDGYGNPRSDPSYPCDYESVMAVIALQDETTRTTWSDYSDAKDISAPGQNIYSTWYYGNAYHASDGTSMASPIVAGCAALLWAYDPSLSVADVKEALYSTADDLGAEGRDPLYGWGRVNIGAAVASLGTASVKAERPTMVRTTSQQFVASPIKGDDAPRTWKWSVSDASRARIDQKGVLTALAAGKVEVTVESADGATPPLVGHRSITISEIEIPGTVSASADPSENTIVVRWPKAEGAVTYHVLRATDEQGEFAPIGTCESADFADGEAIAFTDGDAQPATPYWYKVVPVGKLDGEDAVGLASVSNRGYYTDKLRLREAIVVSQELLASTTVSEGGSEISVRTFWTRAADRAALNEALSKALTVYWSGSAMQDEVDEQTAALVEANATFKASRNPGTVKLAQTEMTASAATSEHVLEYNAGAARTIKAGSLYSVHGFQGSLSFEKVAGPAGVSVSKSGDVTVGKALPAGRYSLRVKVRASGDDLYEAGEAVVDVAVRVDKAANPLSAKAKKPKVKRKNQAQVVKRAKAYKIAGAQGAVTFAKVGSSKLKVNGKTGAIKVPKKLRRGVYPVKVRVTAAGNGNYKSAQKVLTVKVRVK